MSKFLCFEASIEPVAAGWRKKAGVRLTNAGRRFLETARELVSQLENSARNARAAARGIIGRVKVGILSSIACDFLRHLLQRHLLEHPDVVFHFVEVAPIEHLAHVRSG